MIKTLLKLKPFGWERNRSRTNKVNMKKRSNKQEKNKCIFIFSFHFGSFVFACKWLFIRIKVIDKYKVRRSITTNIELISWTLKLNDLWVELVIIYYVCNAVVG